MAILKRTINPRKLSASELSNYEKFKTIFREKVEKNFNILIKEGKQLQRKAFFLMSLFILPFILFFIINADIITIDWQRFPLTTLIFIGVVYLGYVGIKIYATHVRYKNFVLKYKKNVIEPIIKTINPNFIYFPKEHIPVGDYLESGLFRKHEHFRGDDLIRGSIDDFGFEMSEVHTWYYTGSGKNRKRHSIFDGLFIIFKYKKNMGSNTYIQPDYAERLLGKFLGQKLQSMFDFTSEGDLVKLENPQFEEIFKVRSTDQIEARIILTPVMMEKMISFYNLNKNQPLYFAFKGDIVYMALGSNKFHTNHTNYFFEPPTLLFGMNEATFNFAKSIYNMINFPVEIAKEINNNASVWKK